MWGRAYVAVFKPQPCTYTGYGVVMRRVYGRYFPMHVVFHLIVQLKAARRFAQQALWYV